MKAIVDHILKHGAPTGSRIVDKLAQDYEAHRQSCESVARMLRVMLECSQAGVPVDADIQAVGWAALATLEGQQ